MDYLQEALERKEYELQQLLSKLQQEMSVAPEGTLRITQTSKKKKTYQFYHCAEDTARMGRYIRKSNLTLACQLAQKMYDEVLFGRAQSQLEAVQTLKIGYDSIELQRLYEELSEQKQALIKPWVLNDQQYVEQWLADEYPPMLFEPGTPEFYTGKGERVRSKSEVMIADRLIALGVPYKYEKPLHLDGGTVRPDFTALNVRTREELYWEHLGKMGDEDYSENAVRKINRYVREGIMPGRNLILTYETKASSLSSPIIERCIKEYLL